VGGGGGGVGGVGGSLWFGVGGVGGGFFVGVWVVFIGGVCGGVVLGVGVGGGVLRSPFIRSRGNSFSLNISTRKMKKMKASFRDRAKICLGM